MLVPLIDRHLLCVPRHPAAQPVHRRLRRPRPFPRRCRRRRSSGSALRQHAVVDRRLGRSSSSASASILALLLDRPFPGRGLVQALVFLPWAVPTFLSGLTWAWLFNPVDRPAAALAVRARPDRRARQHPVRSRDSPCGGRSSPMSGAAFRSSPSRCWRRCSRSRASSTRRRRSTAPAPWQRFTLDHAAVPGADHRHHRAAAHDLDRQLRRPDLRHDQRRAGRLAPRSSPATSSPRPSSRSTSAMPRRSRWCCCCCCSLYSIVLIVVLRADAADQAS